MVASDTPLCRESSDCDQLNNRRAARICAAVIMAWFRLARDNASEQTPGPRTKDWSTPVALPVDFPDKLVHWRALACSNVLCSAFLLTHKRKTPPEKGMGG